MTELAIAHKDRAHSSVGGSSANAADYEHAGNEGHPIEFQLYRLARRVEKRKGTTT